MRTPIPLLVFGMLATACTGASLFVYENSPIIGNLAWYIAGPLGFLILWAVSHLSERNSEELGQSSRYGVATIVLLIINFSIGLLFLSLPGFAALTAAMALFIRAGREGNSYLRKSAAVFAVLGVAAGITTLAVYDVATRTSLSLLLPLFLFGAAYVAWRRERPPKPTYEGRRFA